jgi:hypothetical protein
MAAISKLGNYGENRMACVQVDFIQALLPELAKKSNSCIIYRQNQSKRCTEIPATHSVLFLICTHGHNQRPLVPKKVLLKRLRDSTVNVPSGDNCFY